MKMKVIYMLRGFLQVCNFETGKGYPDYGTRRLLSMLVQDLRLPTFALVDGDPYGIEIAAIYKWGTIGLRNTGRTQHFVPALIWLGILPSELSTLSISSDALVDMNEQDMKKLVSVQNRLARQQEPVSSFCFHI